MKGYKSHDPARIMASETGCQGFEDGQADADAMSACPPRDIIGPQQDGWMYKGGYSLGFDPEPCQCDGSCRGGKTWTSRMAPRMAPRGAARG